MSNYVDIFKSNEDNRISLSLNVEDDVIIDLGNKIDEVCTEAYMNGYNWEVLINYYLENNCQNLLDDLNFDTEAGNCIIYYELTPENEAKIQEIYDIIVHFIEHQDELIEFIKEHMDEIPWD